MSIERVIDITPTWASILPVYLTVMESGSAQGRQTAREELGRMAQAADYANEAHAQLRATRDDLDASTSRTLRLQKDLEIAKRMLAEVEALVNRMNAQLNDEDQEGGPQCPTGDTFNDLSNGIESILEGRF